LSKDQYKIYANKHSRLIYTQPYTKGNQKLLISSLQTNLSHFQIIKKR